MASSCETSERHIARVESDGHVVIPAELCEKYNLTAGTRVFFVEQDGKLALQPIPESIAKFIGILKLKPGEKLATEQLLEDRAEDLRREEAKIARHGF